ncbi:MAG: DsbE family thiol:disulfide interchange protein [Gallionellaceae bacterium]|jgi:cytochrome c biogenesis protein CcmG/thiol:disulfide interchange protein DsbE
MMRFILPFVIFIILATFLFVGLNLNPREVPSPLVGKAAPEFSLPQLHTPNRQFSPREMEGKVWLLNVWASWCVSCEAEHPLLIELARQNIVPIVGLDYKDKRQAALVWLERRGNPYVLTVSDVEGRTGIDYGVYGVPETYVIDKKGLIQYKQIGPVTTENLRDKILPLVAELEKK